AAPPRRWRSPATASAPARSTASASATTSPALRSTATPSAAPTPRSTRAVRRGRSPATPSPGPRTTGSPSSTSRRRRRSPGTRSPDRARGHRHLPFRDQRRAGRQLRRAVGGDEAAAGDPAADLPASDGAVAGHRRAPGRHRRHDRPLAARPPASQPPLRRSHAPHRAQRRRGAAARPGDAGIGRLPRRARQASPPPSPITGRPRPRDRPRPPRRTARMTTNKAHRSRTAALIALLSILVVVLAVGAGLGAAGLLGGPSPTSDSEASDGAEPEDAADEATDP